MGQLLSIEEIRLILEPHVSRLSRCVWPVWKRYVEKIPESERLTFDPTAEAVVLQRYMVANVKQHFSGVPGVQFLEEDGFMLGIEGFPTGIDGSIVCRFKKLNGAGESRTYPTRRALAIQRNDTAELEGIPPEATITDIGYVLNGVATGFSEVQVIRVKDKRRVLSLSEESEDSSTTLYQIPLVTKDAPRFTIGARREQQGGSDSNDKDDEDSL